MNCLINLRVQVLKGQDITNYELKNQTYPKLIFKHNTRTLKFCLTFGFIKLIAFLELQIKLTFNQLIVIHKIYLLV